MTFSAQIQVMQLEKHDLDMQSKIFTDFQNETLCVASSIVSYLTF
jgi:hypothetical protein